MTNTYQLVNVEVEKEFDDANNQDGIRPKTIEVKLLANGKEAKDVEGNTIDPIEITIDEDGKGNSSFNDLPRFDSEGNMQSICMIEVKSTPSALNQNSHKVQNRVLFHICLLMEIKRNILLHIF